MPGSRKCTWSSIMPGSRRRPLASITVSPSRAGQPAADFGDARAGDPQIGVEFAALVHEPRVDDQGVWHRGLRRMGRGACLLASGGRKRAQCGNRFVSVAASSGLRLPFGSAWNRIVSAGIERMATQPMRRSASQPPRHAPKRSTAVIAYSEQLGVNRQRGPSSGLIQRFSRATVTMRMRSITGFARGRAQACAVAAAGPGRV